MGALVEPLAVAWHAVDQYPLKKGDEAMVMGAGPIGLGVIQCLKARGAKTIIAVEVAKERQNFAKKFGATHIIDPTKEDVVKRAKEICGGNGPHVALDAAGVPQSVKCAALAVRARGTIVNLAIWEKEVCHWKAKKDKALDGIITDQLNRSLFSQTILSSGRRSISQVCHSHQSSQRPQLTIFLVLGYLKEDFAGVIGALEDGSLKPEQMITSTIKIDRVVEDGYRALIDEKDKHVKILVDCRA